jgi:hypothetical protein
LLGVFDDRGPVDSAEVLDLVSNTTVRTPRTGTITLGWQGRLKDSSAIRVRKIGYTDTLLVLGPRDTLDITLVLRRTATALPTVTTTAKFDLIRDDGQRSGIGQRCAEKRVSCVGQADLMDHPSAKILDFLMKTDGVLMSCKGTAPRLTGGAQALGSGGSASACSATMHGIGGGQCVPTYFLDGMEWQPMGGSALAQLQNFLDAGSIQAIEVYRSEQSRPPRFEGDPRKLCGSIVIWSSR